jgi:dienelactone hydrolase
MTRRAAPPVLICLIFSLTASAQELLRVTEKGKAPQDIRLAKPRDYDLTTHWHPQYQSKEQWDHRARELREQILVSQGLWPMPPRAPLNPVIHGKIDRGDYTIEKVYFSSIPGHYVTGNLYRPKNPPTKNADGKIPAVLSAHGHWNNGRFYEASDKEAQKIVDTGGDKTKEGAKFHEQARSAGLARLGCVVFQYDMVGYADASKPINHREGFTDVNSELRLMNFMGLQTWNSIRALDFIESLDDVDPARIAVTGASGGGTQTMILGAVDPRPATIVPAVMVSANMQGGCICENATLLRVNTNNIEFAALYAPKPQGMTGADDWTKDIETVGLPQLKQIYGLFGPAAADKVEAWYRPHPHNYNQVSRELMYNFLNKHFKLGHSGPIAERPFTPVPPKELSVWDDKHPFPTDASDAAALKETVTTALTQQLEQMVASDPQEYRRIITTALRVMINDKWPVTAQVVAGSQKETKQAGTLVETGLLTRGPEGPLSLTHYNGPDTKKVVAGRPATPPAQQQTAVPYAMLIPEGWNGETILWIHPGGKLTLMSPDNKPIEPVQRILDAKFAVLSADLFATGEFNPDNKPVTALRPVNEKFAGYTFGYNRTVLAERVHDILTLVAFARQNKQSKYVHQIAWEGAGLWGLLVKGMAGEAILRSAIDLNGFDFDQIKSPADENFLPGALKYGGVMTFVSLCRVGETALYRAPKDKEMPLPSRGVREGQGRMTDWVIRSGNLSQEEVPRR